MKLKLDNTRRALGIAADIRDRAVQARPVGAEAGKDILLGQAGGLSVKIGRETL